MKKTKWILLLLIPLQGVAILFIRNQPQWIEENYSQKIYPVFFNLQKFFFSKIPFSFGDIAYGIALLLIVWNLYSLIRRKVKITNLLLNTFATASLISLLFHLHWGLNYYRTSLNEKLNFTTEYTEDQLEQTLQLIITSTNQLHENLGNLDSVPAIIPHSKEQITRLLEKDFDFELYNFKVQPFLKNSLWSTLLSYMGFAGYLNPLTFESQVNYKIPKLNYITTASHEMAHQLGIASEAEANFVAFYSCIKHPDPHIRFAGYCFALQYCYSELYKANPEKAKKQLSKLHKGVLKNFREAASFWKKYQNPLEPYFKKGYDSYLKANGQAMGIQSYNAMVGMVIEYSLQSE